MASDTSYFLRSRRLGFRRWSEGDHDLARNLWGDPRVTRFVSASGSLSEQEVQARLAVEIDSERLHGVQYWPIFRRADNQHVGCCGLRPYLEDPRVRELGFHICADHWRQGYAEEAARAVIQDAFLTRKVDRLFAGHHPDNEASRRLLQKLGFLYSHDEYYGPTGRDHPSYFLKRD